MDSAGGANSMGSRKPYSRIVGADIKEHIAWLQQRSSGQLNFRVIRSKQIQYSSVVIVCGNLNKIAVSQSGLDCARDRFDEAIYRGIEGKPAQPALKRRMVESCSSKI